VPQDIPDTTIMRATWRAVAGGIDRVIALGIADPDRLGIMGHSFGGYGVVSTIVSTHRFRAAVALSGGYYNFPGQFLQLEPDGSFVYTRIGTTNLGGSLWDRSATYVANSPVFFLDRVTTPLLLIDGGSDELTSPQQSEQVFTGLRYLRREVEYVLYPGEGHNYLEWTRAHQLDVVTRILDWLDQHLHARRVTS
jgi:dipeptidyl aminopeptidase/acylaminoacyl peptidase